MKSDEIVPYRYRSHFWHSGDDAVLSHPVGRPKFLARDSFCLVRGAFCLGLPLVDNCNEIR